MLSVGGNLVSWRGKMLPGRKFSIRSMEFVEKKSVS